MTYDEFLDRKTHLGGVYGKEPVFMPLELFDFQSHLTAWAIRKGRSAIFADCGLGKTLMQLVWAENVVRLTGKNVLVLTPLAVSHQTKAEGEKFGIEVYRSVHGETHPGINVTNYERLHLLQSDRFAGVVCDESSILKNFNGSRKQEITDFVRKIPYRLLTTATPAPNDFVELGTSSEALGDMGYMDMLNKFFKNDLNNSATGRYCGEVIKWRLKGHAEVPFWRWVSSWARAIRKPSDIGFDDARFTLPELLEREHIIEAQKLAEGFLFEMPAVGLKEQREEQRRTIPERCHKVAELISHDRPAIAWCHFNEEGDRLESLIPDCVQVSGRDSDEEKEAKLVSFAKGNVRVLVTKPKIGAWGLNFQHCAHMTFFPSHSFEQYYQAVRRCHRFGQTQNVHVDVVTTEGGQGIMKNLQRKERQAQETYERIVAHMNDALMFARSNDTKTMEAPKWLSKTK